MKTVKNAHMGQHLLVEVYNVPFEKLNDSNKIGQVCEIACKTEGLEVLNTYVHQFDPYGVTCTVTLGESHLSCHTWPCLLYTSPSPRDRTRSRMPSSA